MFILQNAETVSVWYMEAVVRIYMHRRQRTQEQFPDKDRPVAATWEHVEADIVGLTTEGDSSEP